MVSQLTLIQLSYVRAVERELQLNKQKGINMLESFIIAIALNSAECRANEVEVRTPYGEICLTPEQVSRLRSAK